MTEAKTKQTRNRPMIYPSKTAVKLTVDQHKRLARMARKRKTSQAGVIRDLIDTFDEEDERIEVYKDGKLVAIMEKGVYKRIEEPD